MKFHDETYEVLLVSLFEQAADDRGNYVHTASRDFDNRVALLSRRTRDTGVDRIITNKGRPVYVLEQGRDSVEWGAMVEWVSLDRLNAAATVAHSWKGITRKTKTAIDQTDVIAKRLKALQVRLTELEIEQQEVESLKLRLERQTLVAKATRPRRP